MANGHQRTSSIAVVRLAQSLPPLPLDDLSSKPSIQPQLPPYRDVPEEIVADVESQQAEASKPPGYEPMYDYLRSHQQQRQPSAMNAAHYICPPDHDHAQNPSQSPAEPYRDELFVITIEASQPPPPSYNELYTEPRNEWQTLIRDFDPEEDSADRSEMICKWIISMLIIALTVAAMGTAFGWGHGCGVRERC